MMWCLSFGIANWDTFTGGANNFLFYVLCLNGVPVDLKDEVIDGKAYLAVNSGLLEWTYINNRL